MLMTTDRVETTNRDLDDILRSCNVDRDNAYERVSKKIDGINHLRQKIARKTKTKYERMMNKYLCSNCEGHTITSPESPETSLLVVLTKQPVAAIKSDLPDGVLEVIASFLYCKACKGTGKPGDEVCIPCNLNVKPTANRKQKLPSCCEQRMKRDAALAREESLWEMIDQREDESNALELEDQKLEVYLEALRQKKKALR